MGTRAFSHDSIFIPDGQAEAEDDQEIHSVSQDYIGGKVKSLQEQLGKNIRFGQPPQAAVPVKRMQDLGASTEEMERSRTSPIDIVQEIVMESDLSRIIGSPWKGSEADEKVTPVKSSRPKRPSGTIDSINLDAVPRSIPRLDNSAAKYKLSVKPKNQRVSKKHRGMSQEYSSVECIEQDFDVHRQQSPDKAMYHPMEMPTEEIIISGQELKTPEVQISQPFESSSAKEERERKKIVEDKQQEIIFPKYEKESLQIIEDKNVQADKQKEEEERKRQEIIKNIELEKLQQKIKQQQETEMMEQRKREEMRKLRAEQILKELEEHRRQDEKRQHELEIQRTLQLAEEKKRKEMEHQKSLQIADEQKKCILELEKALQEAAEEQKKQELETSKALQITEEQKRHGWTEQKSYQQAEEQKERTLKGSNIPELEENKAQQHKEEKMHDEDLTRTEEQDKPELQMQELLQKTGLMNEKVKTNALPAQLASLNPESGATEKELPAKQKTKEEVKEVEEELKQRQQRRDDIQKQERMSEELRWQELDQRQRPFTFTVTSGEKQILFEKVHLSPVSPLKEPVTRTETQEQRENKANISLHALPASQCIPHTAILVTGAQLCGTAVNLNQIKDTACKSLLGLTEERKVDIAEAKNEMDNNKQTSSKTKYTSDSLENESTLAEWASIRSKILSKSENSSSTDNVRRGSRGSNEDSTAKARGEPHSSLRKTMSANAKFSITSAWQKFPENTKSLDISSIPIRQQPQSKEMMVTVLSDNVSQGSHIEKTISVQDILTSKGKKQVTTEDNTEGWIFSKDLPSFLVPYPPTSPRRSQVERQITLETQLSNGMEEKVSPFGIKLRRTNYSLRFNSETQSEQKRKKRYSAGDSFEGIPASFIGADEAEQRTIPRIEPSGSPSKVKKDNVKVVVDTSNHSPDTIHCTVVSSVIPSTSLNVSSPSRDKMVLKSPIMPKPSLAPKPSSPTPPSSPLSRLTRTNMNDTHEQKLDISEQDKETAGEDLKTNAVLSFLNPKESLDHAMTDITCSSSIALREKQDKRPEKIGKDRPILQSRHSLDGTRLMEKVEPAQPLWITLALQKQKGFREQQASREERRQAREAKQSDKLSKENTSGFQTGEYRSRSGSLQKLVPQEERKCESVVTRLQRREQLQKSNTLPTSVTVEITETVPVSLAKDLPKRFSSPDASAVSSEPAWLALAKRKSKAWSDCPQIIK